MIPVSSARMSCVLRASLAEKSVGSAMACREVQVVAKATAESGGG